MRLTLSVAFVSAPAATSASATSARPLRAAHMSAVAPFCKRKGNAGSRRERERESVCGGYFKQKKRFG